MKREEIKRCRNCKHLFNLFEGFENIQTNLDITGMGLCPDCLKIVVEALNQKTDYNEIIRPIYLQLFDGLPENIQEKINEAEKEEEILKETGCVYRKLGYVDVDRDFSHYKKIKIFSIEHIRYLIAYKNDNSIDYYVEREYSPKHGYGKDYYSVNDHNNRYLNLYYIGYSFLNNHGEIVFREFEE